MSWEWSRKNEKDLARFVTPEAVRWLHLSVNRTDLLQQPDGRRQLVQTIYKALAAKQIRYAPEKYHPSEAIQLIRTPPEILEAPKEGTCLDLAALFCGLCLGYDLLPWLVVIEGHALAAVSLRHGLREWNTLNRRERAWFEEELLTDPIRLRKLVDSGAYLLLECTGFAHSCSLSDSVPEGTGRTEEGLMPFEQAIVAGRQQLEQADHPFHFAIDIAVAHYGWRIDPHTLAGQYLVKGITALPTDYSTRFQNFLTEYLGTPEQPVPFGGREADLEGLDNWLEDSHQPPYLLLAAPAGRGKSALLVRWSRQLLGRDDVEVIFFPVSIRFRTNLASVVFASIAARLATLHGDPVPGTPDTSVEIWRGIMADYLSRPLPEGRRLLIVLDGVDEAADWEPGPDLFPFSLPLGIRVVLSARYLAGDADASAWLRRLGWDRPGLAHSLALYPLSRQGIADVLNRMGFPLDQLGKRVDIVAELYRLSEGDPLLVRLYVDDLWARGKEAARLQPEDLYQIKPGLEGFFTRWWEDQRRLWGSKTPLREPAVQALLNLLACALGPLTQNDVLKLAPPEANLNFWTLEEALLPLQRLIIGDGRDQGYAFGHPRLSVHFYGRLGKVAQDALESRFLNWGRGTLKALNEKQISAANVSPYLIQYYSSHLERGGCTVQDWTALSNEGWLQAWYRLEGAYAGFLNDVKKAWQNIERANTEISETHNKVHYLGTEIRSALILTSVASLATNIPPILLLTLVGKKVWTPTQGLAYANQILDTQTKAIVLSKLASYLVEPLFSEVISEAVAVARTINNEKQRVKLLIDLSDNLLEPQCNEILSEALTLAYTIRNEKDRIEVLCKLTRHLLEPQRSETSAEAIKMIIHTIWDEAEQVEMLSSLFPYLSETLKIKVLKVIRKIKSKEKLARALSKLIEYLPESQQRSAALAEVLEIANIIDYRSRAELLSNLAPHLTEPRRNEVLAEILKIVSTINYDGIRVEILNKLARHFPKSLLVKARVVAGAIKNEERRAEVLSRLTYYLPELEADKVLTETLTTAYAIRDEERRALLLIKLFTTHLPEPQRSEVLTDALAATKMIRDIEKRVEMLNKLAPYLPEELLAKALEEARVIGDEEKRVQALSELIPHLPEQQRNQALEETLKAVYATIKNEGTQAEILSKLAIHLPEAKRNEVLQNAFFNAYVIKDERKLIEILIRIASQLPESQQDKSLESTPELFYSTSSYKTIDIGYDLRFRKNDLKKNKVLEIALSIAHAIKDEEKRANLLSGLLPNLSGLQCVAVVLAEIQTMLDVIYDTKKHEINYQQIQAVELPKAINSLLSPLSEPYRGQVQYVVLNEIIASSSRSSRNVCIISVL